MRIKLLAVQYYDDVCYPAAETASDFAYICYNEDMS